MFRPFQTTKKSGLGIGMFQSKMIVEAHRGRITVASEPGKGTTFQVFLPVPASIKIPPQPSPGVFANPMTETNPKPKLLIVEDDDEIRTPRQMKWALTQDYEILLAHDRPSALDLFRSARPSVVLLDLGLPPPARHTGGGTGGPEANSSWWIIWRRL